MAVTVNLLIEELKRAAGSLASRMIQREPLKTTKCSLCLFCALGNNPIQHASWCDVGRVVKAVEGIPAQVVTSAPECMQSTGTMLMRGRPVSHKEAMASAQRLVNSHFHNPDSARCCIPVDYRDDDVTVVDYIREQAWKEELLPWREPLTADGGLVEPEFVETHEVVLDPVEHPTATELA